METAHEHSDDINEDWQPVKHQLPSHRLEPMDEFQQFILDFKNLFNLCP